MSLIDFFFPEQASASNLRRIADRLDVHASTQDINRSHPVDSPARMTALEARLEEIEHDKNVMSVVVMALFKKLCDSSDLTVTQMQSLIKEADNLDGTVDGKIDIKHLRKMFGIEDPVMEVTRKAGSERLCKECWRPISVGRQSCIYCGGSPTTDR